MIHAHASADAAAFPGLVPPIFIGLPITGCIPEVGCEVPGTRTQPCPAWGYAMCSTEFRPPAARARSTATSANAVDGHIASDSPEKIRIGPFTRSTAIVARSRVCTGVRVPQLVLEDGPQRDLVRGVCHPVHLAVASPLKPRNRTTLERPRRPQCRTGVVHPRPHDARRNGRDDPGHLGRGGAQQERQLPAPRKDPNTPTPPGRTSTCAPSQPIAR